MSNKKKTHEEYVAEVTIKNPNIEVVGNYVNAKTKITHHCIKHNIYWDVIPSDILQGKGCCNCSKEKIKNKHSKSHEKYISELALKNPYVQVIGAYINSKTSIMHKCMIHNIEWMISPNNALLGKGCLECKKEKIGKQLRKTHKQYIKEIKTINPDIITIEEYIDANTPILHKCLKDNYEWNVSPHSILNGSGCPKCSNRIHRTHDEYVKEVNLLNNNIEIMEEFINTDTPILHKCKTCEYEWKVRPNHILLGTGCPKCANNIRKTHNEYVKEIILLHPNIKVIGTYISANTPILHKCLVDEYEWLAKPTNILCGKGCPKCGGTMQKSHEEYVYEVLQVNPDIEVVGMYINSKTPILHKCKIDEYKWYAYPSNILKGRGCPQCIESNGERQIRLCLEKYNIKYETQKSFQNCRDVKPLPFDFYLPNYNVCIEYDGRQHYEPVEYFGGQEAFEKTVKHDNIKNEYCKNNGISLLRMPYYKNVEEELNNFLFI